jgi:hypothetical protein
MEKNLDDNEKRLAEKTSAAEVLQKSPARGLFPSCCVDLTESALSDPTQERS